MHLDAWRRVPSGSHWFIEFRGVPETADHIIGAFPRAKNVGTVGHDAKWPYRIRLDFNPDSSLDEFLDFLKEVLVIRIERQDLLDAAIALDFYNQPAAGDSAKVEHTATANLIRLVKKYEQASPAEIDRAGLTLCESLSDAILRHEWLSQATRILPVPGHARDKPSVAVLLGALLTHELGIPRTEVGCLRAERKQAKNMTDDERAALLNEFVIKEDLTGRTVLVLDDVYRTGFTMAGVASAARRAGATTVLGLVAARTLRR
ncbi:phosphoribosyltransferase [Solihabitans fulvus]|uniref:Phosphoribosyltransferase n=1 Tax=Solihabitans fulvus TaxID=1892852 RepID=A0A5B2WSB3_9PSEU|nr:phosphoribosyltransferase [Solihabitans fulvus]KAA2254873.1 phosphoribosyltransferase [Solihabitans fulvus]